MPVESKVTSGPLKAYVPGPHDSWDAFKAAHLLNRAGFGGKPEEISRLEKIGFAPSLDELVNYEQFSDDFPPVDFTELENAYNELRGQRFNFLGKGRAKDDPAVLRLQQEANKIRFQKGLEAIRQCYQRMITTRRPLQEKMTLFWHGHFTSSVLDVEDPRLMYMQNDFFRQNALGKFRDLLVGISKDPAMLKYLNNNTNRKEHPNENYARELQELFTMGVGNYTDEDVKAAARAFTGWTFRNTEFQFNSFQHDYDEKTYLGQTGNFDGGDIIDIILQRPVTAEFMTRKLLKFFAFPQPDEAVIQQGAGILRDHDFEFRPLVRAILGSKVFYSESAYRQQMKSPVQLVVQAIRQMNLDLPDGPIVSLAAGVMGQMIWAPPNVKGWDGGLAWINTSALLLRYNFMNFLSSGQLPGVAGSAGAGPFNLPPNAGRFDPHFQISQIMDVNRTVTVSDLADELIHRFYQAKVPETTRNELVAFLKDGGDGPDTIDLTDSANQDKVKETIHLLMSTPEFQVC